MKRIYKLCFVLTLTFFTSNFAKVIIWDLGGVLLKTNKIGMARQIGIRSFLSYILRDWRTPNIKPLLFSILDQIPTHEIYQSRAVNEDGTELPAILCEWQSGKKSSIEASLQVQAYVDYLDSQDFFISRREKNLVKRTIQTMFDPVTLADNTVIIQKGLEILYDCYTAHQNGSPEQHRLMVISNWDASSFSLVYNKFPELFQFFHPEDIIISSVVGLIKPDKRIFEYLLDVYNLNPEECVFIDDQKANVAAAQACGMQAIALQNKNYNHLRKELIKLNIL